MKKMILTLGLGTLLTMSNLLASDLTITEQLADKPVTANHFKGYYIKPFFGSWKISGKESNGVSMIALKNAQSFLIAVIKPRKGDPHFSFYGVEQTMKDSIVAGIAIGKHLNEYIGIEGNIGYYHTNNFKHGYIESLIASNDNTRYYANVFVNHDQLKIINAILNPVINANITENISLYFTTGICASYIILGNNIRTLYEHGTSDINGVKTQKEERANDETHYYNNAQKFHFSWTMGLGIRIHLTESTELDVGYGYKYLGKLPTSQFYQFLVNNHGVGLDSIPLLVHEMRIGLKFNF